MDRQVLLNNYESYLKVKGIRTRKDYQATVDQFFEWCEEEKLDILNLHYCDVSTWRRQQMETSLSWATINNKTNRLRSFYRYLLISHKVLTNPFDGLQGLKTGKSLPKNIVSPEDYEKLVSSFRVMKRHDVMLLALIELLYGSALRISEAASLKEQDIDFDSRIIMITDHKNQRERKLPATEAALVSIRSYNESVRSSLLTDTELLAGFLFPQKKGTSLRVLLNSRLKNECRRQGLPLITSHSFRHSAATGMLKNGAGIRHVQEFLGHKSIISTQRYTHLVSDDLKKVIENCHPREARS